MTTNAGGSYLMEMGWDLNKPDADWTPADYTTWRKMPRRGNIFSMVLEEKTWIKFSTLTMLKECGMLSKKCMRAVMNSRPAENSNFKVSIILLR